MTGLLGFFGFDFDDASGDGRELYTRGGLAVEEVAAEVLNAPELGHGEGFGGELATVVEDGDLYFSGHDVTQIFRFAALFFLLADGYGGGQGVEVFHGVAHGGASGVVSVYYTQIAREAEECLGGGFLSGDDVENEGFGLRGGCSLEELE